MSVLNRNEFSGLKMLGIKQAKPTHFWVHPDVDLVFYIRPDDTVCGGHRLSCPSVTSSDGGYVTVRFQHRTYQYHVLKALAFHPIPDEYQTLLGDHWEYVDLKRCKIVVNHKDGDKQNNALDNLEWSTYRDNNIHAFKTGLRTDNYFGFCYDIIEDREFEFYSINELGRMLNVHADYISKYLKGVRTGLFQHRYLIRKADEIDYPNHLTRDDMWRYSIAGISPLEVTNLKTGEVMEFGSVAAATSTLKLNPIKKALFRTKHDSKKIGHFQFKPVCDYDRIMKIKAEHDATKYESINKNRTIRKPLPVTAQLSNGEVLRFDSRRDAAKHFNIPDTLLKSCLYRSNGKWRNIQFKYERELPMSSQASNP